MGRLLFCLPFLKTLYDFSPLFGGPSVVRGSRLVEGRHRNLGDYLGLFSLESGRVGFGNSGCCVAWRERGQGFAARRPGLRPSSAGDQLWDRVSLADDGSAWFAWQHRSSANEHCQLCCMHRPKGPRVHCSHTPVLQRHPRQEDRGLGEAPRAAETRCTPQPEPLAGGSHQPHVHPPCLSRKQHAAL